MVVRSGVGCKQICSLTIPPFVPFYAQALINGTQLMTSIGAEAVTRARNVSLAADLACALAVETLRGTPRSFEQCIHDTRMIFLGRILCFSILLIMCSM